MRPVRKIFDILESSTVGRLITFTNKIKTMTSSFMFIIKQDIVAAKISMIYNTT